LRSQKNALAIDGKEFLAPTDPGDGMKRFIENFPSSIATLARRGVVSVALVVLTASPTILAGQSTQAVLTSRSDLTAAAVQAESGTRANGNGTRNAMLAAASRPSRRCRAEVGR
jgi:hypothetical protein